MDTNEQIQQQAAEAAAKAAEAAKSNEQNQEPASFFHGDNSYGGSENPKDQSQQQPKQNPDEQVKIKTAEDKFNAAKVAYEKEPLNIELKTAYENSEKEYNTLKNPVKSIFSEIPEIKDANKQFESQKQVFTNLAKKLNLKVEGDVNEDVFVKTYNDTLAAASTKVELDKTKYTPEVAEMFEFVENQGDPREFLSPLSGIIDFLGLSSEEKIRFVMKNNKMTDDQVKEKLDSLTEEKKLDEEAGKYTKEAIKLRDKAISDVNQKHKSRMTAYNESERQKNERIANEVVKSLTTMTTFMGEPLTDDARNYFRSEILNGNFNRSFLNNPEALMKGFLFDRFGDKIYEKLKGSIANASSQSNKAGADSVKVALHNNLPIEEGGGGARVAGKEGEKGFGWKDHPDFKS
jgi:hypothetical protein